MGWGKEKIKEIEVETELEISKSQSASAVRQKVALELAQQLRHLKLTSSKSNEGGDSHFLGETCTNWEVMSNQSAYDHAHFSLVLSLSPFSVCLSVCLSLSLSLRLLCNNKQVIGVHKTKSRSFVAQI
jgi:hypothetical protein